jgi:homoserine dehydrogenase
VIDAAVNLQKGSHASLGTFTRRRIRSIDEVSSAFYVNLVVADEPGVLAAVAGAFGRHGVSIRSMEQSDLGDGARIVFITHEAGESAVRSTLRELNDLPAVRRVNSVLRVIEGSDS